MNRTITYHITQLPFPHKISGFLKEKGYSEQNLTDLRKREQAICLNGTYVHMNQILTKGDILTVYIQETESSEQIRPVKLPVTIVYEDEDLLVINKSAGMPIHPSRNNPDNSLGNALAWYFKEQNKPFVFRCINRLDRDTSGLTIVAKHAVSAAILGQMVREKSTHGLEAQGRKHDSGCWSDICTDCKKRGSLSATRGGFSKGRPGSDTLSGDCNRGNGLDIA